MVNNYQNNLNFSIDLENIGNYLKNIVELISKPPKQVINKIIDKNSYEEISYESSVIEISVKIDNLYKNMDEIAILLKNNDFFYDEYFDFREIQDMIKDTLNRDFSNVTFDDLGFIIELIRNFSDLISYKIILAETDDFNEKNYELKRHSYFSNLNGLKKYFFEHVCDDCIDDDLFLEYSKIIRG